MSKIIEKENLVVVKPGKNVDVSMVEGFKEELDSLIRELPRDLTIDLSGVEIVDSQGVEVIVSMHDFLKQKGLKLKITNTSEDIYEQLNALNLDRPFSVHKAK